MGTTKDQRSLKKHQLTFKAVIGNPEASTTAPGERGLLHSADHPVATHASRI